MSSQGFTEGDGQSYGELHLSYGPVCPSIPALSYTELNMHCGCMCIIEMYQIKDVELIDKQTCELSLLVFTNLFFC